MPEKESPTPYSKFVTQLTGVTEAFLGVKIPDATKQTWENLYQLIHKIDKRYDEQQNPAKRQQIAESTVNFIRNHNAPYPYPDDQEIALATPLKEIFWQKNAENFAAKLAHVFDITEQLRQAKNPVQYAYLTLQDGASCADLFCDLLPPEIQARPGFTSFEKLMKHLAAAHKAIDSIQDLPIDHDHQQTEIKPGITAYYSLAIGLLGQIPPIIFDGGLTIFSSRTQT